LSTKDLFPVEIKQTSQNCWTDVSFTPRELGGPLVSWATVNSNLISLSSCG
jgi:hypothetical protein